MPTTSWKISLLKWKLKFWESDAVSSLQGTVASSVCGHLRLYIGTREDGTGRDPGARFLGLICFACFFVSTVALDFSPRRQFFRCTMATVRTPPDRRLWLNPWGSVRQRILSTESLSSTTLSLRIFLPIHLQI